MPFSFWSHPFNVIQWTATTYFQTTHTGNVILSLMATSCVLWHIEYRGRDIWIEQRCERILLVVGYYSPFNIKEVIEELHNPSFNSVVKQIQSLYLSILPGLPYPELRLWNLTAFKKCSVFTTNTCPERWRSPQLTHDDRKRIPGRRITQGLLFRDPRWRGAG